MTIRAISLSLKDITTSKKNKINNLIGNYRTCVNQFLQIFKTFKGKIRLNKELLATVQDTPLSERFKSNAIKQAIGIWKSFTSEGRKKYKDCPKFKGYPILDAKFVTIEEGQKSFDLILKLSTLQKGERITLVTHKHKRFNYWNDKANLIQGCELRKNKLIVWFKLKDEPLKTQGKDIGADLGMNHLVVTSDGEFYGSKFKELRDKIAKKKKGSKAKKKALRELGHYKDKVANELDWDDIKLFVHEDLTNIMKGKKGFRKFKKFRAKQRHWRFRQVLSRLIEKAQENRVRLVYVNPKNTSRTCPTCGNVDAQNRKLECFLCTKCSYKDHSDVVGARNILQKGLLYLASSVESLVPAKV
jgi:IS605 OrfB family transposase